MVTRLPAGALVPIHATSMTPAEIGSLAASGGVTGLRPITDANPDGDGIDTAMRRVLH